MFDIGKSVAACGVALFVSETGEADGEPIVLLHGGLGSQNDFLPLAQHLVTDFRLIAIESRWYGRSTLGIATPTYHQLEDDIAAVLTKLGLTKAGSIGHSDGGIVALRLAASGIVQLRFVVAVGAHWQMPADDPTREIYQGISRVLVGRAEIGAAWSKRSNEGRDYLGLSYARRRTVTPTATATPSSRL